MPFFMFLLVSITALFAAEIATIDPIKNSNEVSVVMTDETLQTNMEKHFLARPCKLRISTNAIVPVRENNFAKVCRADVIKFLIDNGYKPDQHFRTFTK